MIVTLLVLNLLRHLLWRHQSCIIHPYCITEKQLYYSFFSEEIFFGDLHEDLQDRGRMKKSSMQESYLFHLYCRVLYLLACLIWLRALSIHLNKMLYPWTVNLYWKDIQTSSLEMVRIKKIIDFVCPHPIVYPFQYDKVWPGANFNEFCEYKIWQYLSAIWYLTFGLVHCSIKNLNPNIYLGPGGSTSLDWES